MDDEARAREVYAVGMEVEAVVWPADRSRGWQRATIVSGPHTNPSGSRAWDLNGVPGGYRFEDEMRPALPLDGAGEGEG